MQHTLKIKLKHAFPPALLNAVLLKLPILYQTSLVFFETNLTTTGIDELLAQIRTSIHVEGDIIECGSSRCGASIIMAKYLKTNNGSTRKFLLAIHLKDLTGLNLNENKSQD